MNFHSYVSTLFHGDYLAAREFCMGRRVFGNDRMTLARWYALQRDHAAGDGYTALKPPPAPQSLNTRV